MTCRYCDRPALPHWTLCSVHADVVVGLPGDQRTGSSVSAPRAGHPVAQRPAGSAPLPHGEQLLGGR